MGSEYPFDMGVPDPLERLRAAGLGETVTAAVAAGNAGRLGITAAR